MPHYIVKIGDDRYLLWSTVVDAPTRSGMSRAAMMRFLAADSESHGERVDPQGYEERLSLADTNGTDDPRGRSAEDLMSFNRAGPGETCLPVVDLIRSFWGEDESGKVAEFPEG